MSELEQRVKALEAKVKILEETLETLKNMGISEQMTGYIKQKKQTLKMVNLIKVVYHGVLLEIVQLLLMDLQLQSQTLMQTNQLKLLKLKKVSKLV